MACASWLLNLGFAGGTAEVTPTITRAGAESRFDAALRHSRFEESNNAGAFEESNNQAEFAES